MSAPGKLAASPPLRDAPSLTAAEPLSAGRCALLTGLILIGALAWRIVLAALMPAISRDGVLWCWFARDLGLRGLRLLREDAYDQHPLFPALVLALQRAGQLAGATDGPLTWQTAGQAASILGGLGVIAASGVLGLRLGRALGGPGRAQRVSLWSMTLAALLPLNVWLSADVMSDQIHLALYLLAVALLTNTPGWPPAALGGACGGLAFLTRPEGGSVALVALAAMALRALRKRSARPLAPALATLVGFAVVAAPYMLIIGGVSPKADKQTLDELHHGAAASPQELPLALAALRRDDVSWWQAGPRAALETLRAGRVVLPALGLAALLMLRRRWTDEPLSVAVGCLLVHFALIALLVKRHGYLDPRHTLVIVALLTPLAALSLSAAPEWARGDRQRRWTIRGLMLLTVAPLVLYALRVPNGADVHVPRAVTWLRNADGALHGRTLLGGKSERRIAFYAGMRYIEWSEGQPTAEAKADALRDLLRAFEPDYLAIETGSADELSDNERVLRALREDDHLGRRLQEAARFRAGRKQDGELLLLRVLPAEPT
ncbi:MAG TPA: hypothetical protein PKC49_00625 [Phycisphaerae bacterium]|nr:hypothetical protein [Phycisphaerae bacterium]